MRKTTGLLLALVLAAGCNGQPESESAPKPVETFSEPVTLYVLASDAVGTAIDSAFGNEQSSCEELTGQRGLLHRGAIATLKSADGDVVGQAELVSAGRPGGMLCAWEAFFPDVPKGGGSYTASVGLWESEPASETGVELGKKLTISVR